MSTSSSKSASSSQTSSVSEDNRIVADNGGVALGKDAALMINNEFSDNVLAGFNQLVSLVRDAGQVVVKSTEQATSSANNAVSAVSTAYDRKDKGLATTLTDMLPLILLAGVVIFLFAKKN